MSNSITPNLDDSWYQILHQEFEKNYFKQLKSFLIYERKSKKVYPNANKIFNALNSTPFKNVKVVILGQDPYHGEGQANGLSFSVNKGVKLPPSLKNIYKEIERDLKVNMPLHGDLSAWAKQGVLLLNSTLTVNHGDAGSHQGKGWEEFTDVIIKSLSEKRTNLVFMLWGNFAQSKSSLINNKKHCILTTTHPSPFSAYRGFLGSHHFSKCNDYLTSIGDTPIDWLID